MIVTPPPAQNVARPAQPQLEKNLNPNHRILVVDDSESIHGDFRKILGGDAAEADFEAEEAAVFGHRAASVQRAPFKMDFALQGEQGLALVCAAVKSGERYAVAFVDMRMPPGWDGLVTTQKLWEADPDLQIVICTAYSDYSWEEMMEVIGSPHRLLILKKPFDTIELLQLAHALTEKWSLLQGSRSNTAALEVLVEKRTCELQGVNALLEMEIAERKESHVALQKEREFLAALVDNVSDGIVACDAKGVLTLFNGATREFHGLPAEAIPASEWAEHFDLYLPDGVTLMAKEEIPLFRALEHGSVRDAEMVIAPRQGRARAILASGRAFHNAQGEKIGAVVAMHDVTERQQAQERLRLSEAALVLAQQVAHLGSWELDLENLEDLYCNALRWSNETFRIFGFKPETIDVTCDVFFEMVHPEDRERVRRGLIELVRAGTQYSLDHRIIRGDGLERVVHEEATLIFDEESNHPIKVAGTVHDVTDRKAVEEKLREQAEMLNLAHDAIVVRRCEDRVITFWNRGAELLYGWTASEAIGQRIDELLYQDQAHFETVAGAVETSGQFRGEVHQVAKDGRRLVVSARANVIQRDGDSPRSVLIIQSDITEHKKLESQFLRAQRLESIGTLASGVAHDLNNVLSPILMSAPLLRDELSPVLKNRIVDTIEKSAERGAQIVKQVLTFARGVEGERILLDPRHLIREVVEVAEQTFPKTILLTSRYAEDLGLVEGDPTQLHQVLLNLCLNARDAMPRGGTLMLSAENFYVDENYASMMPDAKSGPHLLITARDTGEGIPRNILDKIFDPFFTTKEVGHGTGLGLSTLLGIVKGHGGFVAVQSEADNGTTFRVYLPIATGTAAAAEIASAPPEGHGEAILVVDDEPAILAVTKLILEDNNYRVFCADDGPDALAIIALEKEGIDVVITDLMMPFMDGVAVVRSIKKMNPNVRFVASTGMGEQTRASELSALGVTAYLSKPYNHEKLLRTVRELIETAPSSIERSA